MLTIEDLNPNRLYVIPLGVGDAFTRIFFNSSLLVIAGGRVALIDCPSPLRRVFHDAGKRAKLELDLDVVHHVILTHLHGDHCNGLEELGYYKHYVLKHDRPHLYMLSELIEPLWSGRLSASMGGHKDEVRSLDTFFQVHRWDEGQRFRLAGTEPDLEFEIRRTRHSVPCFGLKIRYGMFTLAYSGDGEFDEEHIEFLSEGDLIIHEAGGTPNHTHLEQLRELPAKIRSRMALIHVPDNFNYFDSDIPVLSEGSVYDTGQGPQAITI